MSVPIRGVVLAAGRGSRMAPLTSDLPKPLLPKPENCLLQNQLDFLRPFVDELFVTVGFKSERVLDFLTDSPSVVTIDTTNQSNSAFLRSPMFSSWSGIVVVLTCDNPMSVNMQHVLAEALGNRPYSYLVATRTSKLSSVVSGDRIAVEEELVVGVGPNFESDLLASGLQILCTDGFANLQNFSGGFHDVWRHLTLAKLLRVSKMMPTRWFAVDTPNQLFHWTASR